MLTAAEQVGKHLRDELGRGAWGGRMPGGSRLAAELGVGRDTVEAALKLLEQEGLLVPQGAGRRRMIAGGGGKVARPLRVAILAFEPTAVELAEGYMTDLLHRLGEAGHKVFFAEKCLTEQPFVKGDKETVGQVAKNAGMTIKQFVHWELSKG